MTAARPPAVTQESLRAAAGAVPDPEIPVLTLDDLGIVRDLRLVGAPDGAQNSSVQGSSVQGSSVQGSSVQGPAVEVDLTPTYTGCPATAVIADDVRAALLAAGAGSVGVRTVLSPAWTTDWMSAEGRRKLTEFGIAPPGARRGPGVVRLTLAPRCPRCGSPDTREVSRFGSTPCKALWSCRSCAEPFDAFKAI